MCMCVVASAAAGERGGPEGTGAVGGDHEMGPQNPPSGEETEAREKDDAFTMDSCHTGFE